MSNKTTDTTDATSATSANVASDAETQAPIASATSETSATPSNESHSTPAPSQSASSLEPTLTPTSTTKKGAVVLRKSFGVNNTKNQKPIKPKGTRVYRKDNDHVDHAPAVVGKVELKKASIWFKAANGNLYQHPYPGIKDIDWNSPTSIGRLNKWRSQLFKRHYKGDIDYETAPGRPRWTLEEIEFIKSKLAALGRDADSEDYKAIAKAHKVKFVGSTVKIGTKLADGRQATTEQTLRERTWSAIKTKIEKQSGSNKKRKATKSTEASEKGVETANRGLPAAEGDGPDYEDEALDDRDTESEESDEEPMRKKTKTLHRGDLEHHLESNSDDEDDGQKPAAQPRGAVLVGVQG